jgi:hypothetical protein
MCIGKRRKSEFIYLPLRPAAGPVTGERRLRRDEPQLTPEKRSESPGNTWQSLSFKNTQANVSPE